MRLAVIAVAWLAYCVLHSLLADADVKSWFAARWPKFMPCYRLAFNILSVLTLLPVLFLVYSTESIWLWRWQGIWAWLADGLALASILCFFASTRSYNMDEFLGLRQLKEHVSDDQQGFTLSIFHRFVRHPWYSFSLILIWTRDMNEPLLISALAITLYLVLGSKLEESTLIARYGERYRTYISKVPGLIPLPWKYLSTSEAEALMHRYPLS